MQVLVLASGSQYRAQLLRRLNLEFQAVSPDIDESPAVCEAPATLASRLAQEKACAAPVSSVADSLNQPSIIIASDQVASVNDKPLGKPGSVELARAQLHAMSGKTVRFYTALHLRSVPDSGMYTWLDTTVANVRSLSDDEITRYVAADNPLDCAGSFKVESAGISLFDSIQSDDPTALIGLPLIALSRGLRSLGLTVP